MLPLKRILAPTDLSDLSQDGVRLALEIGKSQSANVTVYHVVEPQEAMPNEHVPCEDFTRHLEFGPASELIAERKRLLARFIRQNFADLVGDVKIIEHVQLGTPYQKILECASDQGMDLIVLSTHGKTGLLHCLIGSVTELVVRLAPCPVLSVQPTRRRRQMVTKAA